MSIEFIEKIKDQAITEMKNHGILASLTIAQAILESGWGKSDLSIDCNNLFGIKWTSNFRGEYKEYPTQEYVNGQYIVVSAKFRKYNTMAESISDHTTVLLQDRYKKLIGVSDYVQACKLIKECGYATDINYPSLLITIIEENKLYQYDEMKVPTDTMNVPIETWYNENGQATVLCDVLNIRNSPSTKLKEVDKYYKGDTFNYDRVIKMNGYYWVSYISFSGQRRYVASRTIDKSEIYLQCV
jgi:lysozyme